MSKVDPAVRVALARVTKKRKWTGKYALDNELIGDEYTDGEDRRIASKHYFPPHVMVSKYKETGEKVVRVNEEHGATSAEHAVWGGCPARHPEYWDGWTRIVANGPVTFFGYAPMNPEKYKEWTGRELPAKPHQGGSVHNEPVSDKVYKEGVLPGVEQYLKDLRKKDKDAA